MTSVQVKKYCKLDKESEELVKLSFEKLNLTARAYTRILKLARTIADLEGSEEIKIVRETIMNELATNLLEEQVTESMQELFDNLITMISVNK